jgi:hypothetical protein
MQLVAEVRVGIESGRQKMESFLHWISTNSTLLAILVTVGVAVLLVCCMGCSNCPAREKDDLFRRHDA